MKTLLSTIFFSFLTLLLLGCATTNSVYYAGMEKAGFHKRDIMVDRVKGVQESQKDAQDEFKSALEHFGTLVNLRDTDLKKAYEKFNSQYEDAKSSAEDLRDRIDKLEDVSLALFAEWNEELSLYKNAKLKAQSQKQLQQTKAKYNKMMQAMRSSEKSMTPILATLQDNVLILKHSLNAQAIGALQGEFGALKKEIGSLIAGMNKSIQESNVFIETMSK